MCYLSTKALWDNVTLMYLDLRNQSQLYELQLKFGEVCQGENFVTKYFHILKGLWQDLDLFNDFRSGRTHMIAITLRRRRRTFIFSNF